MVATKTKPDTQTTTAPPSAAQDTSKAAPAKTDRDAWANKGWWHPAQITGSLIAGLIGGIWFASDNQPFLVFFIIGFVVVTVAVYCTLLFGARRRYQIRHWCEDHGWEFIPFGNPFKSGVVQHSSDLQDSCLYWHRGTYSNSMNKKFGDRGVSVHNVTKHDRDSNGNEQSKTTSFLVMDSGGSCSRMVLHTHHFLDKLHIPGSMRAVEFESSAFNKKWTVKSSDPKATYAVFDQSTLDALMKVEHPAAIELIGGLLIAHHSAENLDIRQQLMRFVERFTRGVPDDLIPGISLLPAGSKALPTNSKFPPCENS